MTTLVLLLSGPENRKVYEVSGDLPAIEILDAPPGQDALPELTTPEVVTYYRQRYVVAGELFEFAVPAGVDPGENFGRWIVATLRKAYRDARVGP